MVRCAPSRCAAAGAYRSQLLPAWCAGCRQLGIPASSPFSLSEVLSNAVELLEWSLQGLPSDTVSVDNGLIVTRGIRRPLIIDPQQQCTRWVPSRRGWFEGRRLSGSKACACSILAVSLTLSFFLKAAGMFVNEVRACTRAAS